MIVICFIIIILIFLLSNKKNKNNNYIKYFAYGANVNKKVMKRRNIKYINKEIKILNNYKLIFNVPGIPYIEPVFANIEPKNNNYVIGMLYTITENDLDRIKKYETGYKLIELIIDGNEKVYTFIGNKVINESHPSKRYKNNIIEGAKNNLFPKFYIDDLEKKKINHNMITNVMDYVLSYDFIIKIIDFIQSLIF